MLEQSSPTKQESVDKVSEIRMLKKARGAGKMAETFEKTVARATVRQR